MSNIEKTLSMITLEKFAIRRGYLNKQLWEKFIDYLNQKYHRDLAGDYCFYYGVCDNNAFYTDHVSEGVPVITLEQWEELMNQTNKPSDFKGDLKGFPPEVVARMLECQKEQGNTTDITVFEKHVRCLGREGGFDWVETKERSDFWYNVIERKNFNEFFQKYPKKEEFVLPEDWYIVIDNSKSKKLIRKWFTSKFPSSTMYSYNIGAAYGFIDGACVSRCSAYVDELSENGSVEITIEQFKKYVMTDKKIIGYKTKPEYETFVAALAGRLSLLGKAPNDYNFQLGSPHCENFKKAGVLDLWFEPVYKREVQLPEIGGYKGELKGEFVVYGCQKVHKSLFDESLCTLEAITVKGEVVGLDMIKQIRTYLKQNG